MGAEAARGRGRRGARRGARDADIRLAIGLPELRDAARGAAILGSGCAPNVWVWYRMVSRRYPRPRALGFAGLLLPISAARPDPAPEPTLCGSAPTQPRRPLEGAVAGLQLCGGPNYSTRTRTPLHNGLPAGLPRRLLGCETSSDGPTDALVRTCPAGARHHPALACQDCCPHCKRRAGIAPKIYARALYLYA